MKTNTHGTSWRSARLLTASVFALMTLASGSAALANGNKSTFVSGNSTYSDCGSEGSDFALLLTGDLEGCLSVHVEGFKCTELEDFDLYVERGRETFAGAWHGEQGSFNTTYAFTAAMAKGFCQSFDLSLEVAGGCIHPLRGTGGVFKGAKGVINFFDVIAGVTGNPVTGEYTAGTGGNNFLYYGNIKLK